MFNLHASGGCEMMKRCKDRVDEVCLKEKLRRPKIISVTVLTSLDSDSLKNELCVQHGVKAQVKTPLDAGPEGGPRWRRGLAPRDSHNQECLRKGFSRRDSRHQAFMGAA